MHFLYHEVNILTIQYNIFKLYVDLSFLKAIHISYKIFYALCHYILYSIPRVNF